MRRVALVGAGISKFGVRRASYRDLIWEAGKACFDSVVGIKPRDVEGLVVGSVMPERTAFQSHISSMAAEALGIKPSVLSARTEHMCASITDGAAAVIVASEERARALTDRPVWIRGTGQALDGFQLTSLHEDYAHWPALKRAADAAYTMAGVRPGDVDLAEVHDCFAIAEMIAYEELGLCKKGQAGAFVAA